MNSSVPPQAVRLSHFVRNFGSTRRLRVSLLPATPLLVLLALAGSLAAQSGILMSNGASINPGPGQVSIFADSGTHRANYCDPNNISLTCTPGSMYDTFTGLTSDTTYNFYIHAGQGTPGCSGSSCPYATTINTAHGPH